MILPNVRGSAYNSSSTFITVEITMPATVSWNIVVSPDTDQSVRNFIASQGGSQKSDLSQFIEEAVRSHILELTADQAKSDNSDVCSSDLNAMINEAVQWARER